MSGNLSPILAKSDEVKNCKNQYVKRIMQYVSIIGVI